MNHVALPRFWYHYRQLTEDIRQIADKNFSLLQADPHHPSLHFKKVGRTRQLWSVRVGLNHRSLAVEKPDGLVWFWIGTHADYEKILTMD